MGEERGTGGQRQKKRERERERDRQTDRQTGRQTDRQTETEDALWNIHLASMMSRLTDYH